MSDDAFGIILIGASGTGKSSVAAELQADGLVQVKPTGATRQVRPIEEESPPCDHIFFSPQEFDALDEVGHFIVVRNLYGSSYGVPQLTRPPKQAVPLLVLKPDFVEPIREQFPYFRIYQIEASVATVIRRMRLRGQPEADIATRMRKYPVETAIGRRLADHIFRNEGVLSHTVREVAKQIHVDQASYLAAQTVSEAEAAPNVTIELPYDETEAFA